VTLACLIASAATIYVLIGVGKATPSEAGHLLGYWPVAPFDVLRPILLTALLFLGPLFEIIVINRSINQHSGRSIIESLSSWQGYRNFVAGPITEEVLFRSVLVPLHVLAKVAPTKIVFLTPLYFGIAHVHHFYEFSLTHPHTPLTGALLRSVFQFAYTTIFGWLATFIFVRTGSLYSCIIIHTLCNWIGLPRLWGRVTRKEDYILSPVAIRGKEDRDAILPDGKGGLGVQWTIAYYVLLIVGVCAFYAQLWVLTESSQALAFFPHELSKKPRRWL
jgi:prenyl protein peptidase